MALSFSAFRSAYLRTLRNETGSVFLISRATYCGVSVRVKGMGSSCPVPYRRWSNPLNSPSEPISSNFGSGLTLSTMISLPLQLGALSPSSPKPNSFSVILRSRSGSRMPRRVSSMTFSATNLAAGSPIFKRHVRQGERHLLRQREIVDELERHGHGHSQTAKMAREILDTFEMAQSAHLSHQARLLLALRVIT